MQVINSIAQPYFCNFLRNLLRAATAMEDVVWQIWAGCGLCVSYQQRVIPSPLSTKTPPALACGYFT